MDGVTVEIGGRRLHSGPHDSGWWLTGLEGWFDAPTTRFDEDVVPEQDGAIDPSQVLVEPRRITVQGTCEVASAGWANTITRPWLASLAKSMDLGFRVYADGWTLARRAKVRGQIKVRDIDETFTEFEIPVWTADPRRYGEEKTLVVNATVAPTGGLAFPVVDGALSFGEAGAASFPGVFQVENPGTADFFPTFTVRGPVTDFTITSEGRVIEYAAPLAAGQELVLSPYLGGRAVLDGVDVSHNLTQAGWVPVEGGQTRGYFFNATDPGLGAQLEVTYPAGAWW